MDKMEEYIRKNREELDRLSPSPEVWRRIRKDLHPTRSTMVRWISVAAMIVVVLTVAALFYVNPDGRKIASSGDKHEIRLVNANPELKETEIYYNNLINSLYSEAVPLLTAHKDMEDELLSDLSQLDSLCTDIKKDLRDRVSNQEVIDALINNYRIRIQILEEMLVLLKENENNTEKKQNHEL
jgi:hypothetical protein